MAAFPQWNLLSMGLTKSVQPYWRLAIATIPTMPTISWTHRAPVDAGLPATDGDAVPILIHLHCGSHARLGMCWTSASQSHCASRRPTPCGRRNCRDSRCRRRNCQCTSSRAPRTSEERGADVRSELFEGHQAPGLASATPCLHTTLLSRLRPLEVLELVRGPHSRANRSVRQATQRRPSISSPAALH